LQLTDQLAALGQFQKYVSICIDIDTDSAAIVRVVITMYVCIRTGTNTVLYIDIDVNTLIPICRCSNQNIYRGNHTAHNKRMWTMEDYGQYAQERLVNKVLFSVT
jgi:hypothetical protein